MELVIVTGLSGAGKTATLNVLEDEGFLCVDNLPTPLINDLVKLMDDMPEVDRVALALDQRNRIFTKELYNNIKELKDDLAAKVIFLNSTDEVLIKRFKERRRPHPLAPKGLIMDGIKLERDRMQKIQDISFVLDTSSLSLGELKRAVHSFLEESDDINIVLTTFGFKHGMVMDADLVFDVRFITNPYYIPELKEKSGYVDEVYDFVLNHEETREFIDRVYELLKFLIPLYEREGKEQLVVAFGCTGGRQRSVSVARRLQELFKYDGRNIILLDRDLES